MTEGRSVETASQKASDNTPGSTEATAVHRQPTQDTFAPLSESKSAPPLEPSEAPTVALPLERASVTAQRKSEGETTAPYLTKEDPDLCARVKRGMELNYAKKSKLPGSAQPSAMERSVWNEGGLPSAYRGSQLGARTDFDFYGMKSSAKGASKRKASAIAPQATEAPKSEGSTTAFQMTGELETSEDSDTD